MFHRRQSWHGCIFSYSCRHSTQGHAIPSRGSSWTTPPVTSFPLAVFSKGNHVFKITLPNKHTATPRKGKQSTDTDPNDGFPSRKLTKTRGSKEEIKRSLYRVLRQALGSDPEGAGLHITAPHFIGPSLVRLYLEIPNTEEEHRGPWGSFWLTSTWLPLERSDGSCRVDLRVRLNTIQAIPQEGQNIKHWICWNVFYINRSFHVLKILIQMSLDHVWDLNATFIHFFLLATY